MEKKHAATKKKIKDAKSEGQVAKSQDLLRLVGLVVGFEFASLLKEPLSAGFITLFSKPSEMFALPFEEAVERVLSFGLAFFFTVALGAMLVLVMVKVLATWAQSGFVFSTKSITPSFNKMNPAQQLGQMFSANKMWDLFAGIIKIILIAGFGLLLMRQSFPDLMGMSSLKVIQLWDGLHELLMPIIRSLLMLLVVVSVIDVIMQNHFHKKRLKMSDEEVKQERKSQDGDATIKSKRRSLAQQLLADNPQPQMNVVKDADVVVVNPTHIAIALSYKPGEMPLPVVTYKTTDQGALDTIDFAKSHQVPVIRYLWLARTLHGSTAVGATIPRETIQAAAAIFRVIKQLADAELNGDGDGSVEAVLGEEGVYEIRDTLNL